MTFIIQFTSLFLPHSRLPSSEDTNHQPLLELLHATTLWDAPDTTVTELMRWPVLAMSWDQAIQELRSSHALLLTRELDFSVFFNLF